MEKINEWAKLDFNGRQIRNVVLTAESLALGKSNYLRMDPSHIESECFRNALTSEWDCTNFIAFLAIIRDTLEFNDAIESEKKRRTLRVGSVPKDW
jgi:hypothetical protein